MAVHPTSEEKRKSYLVKTFSDEFFLLLLVRLNDLNSSANGAGPLCISECGLKLEDYVHTTVGHSYLKETCQRLVSQGFLSFVSGDGGRKNLR